VGRERVRHVNQSLLHRRHLAGDLRGGDLLDEPGERGGIAHTLLEQRSLPSVQSHDCKFILSRRE
jgi:hypothetical protein